MVAGSTYTLVHGHWYCFAVLHIIVDCITGSMITEALHRNSYSEYLVIVNCASQQLLLAQAICPVHTSSSPAPITVKNVLKTFSWYEFTVKKLGKKRKLAQTGFEPMRAVLYSQPGRHYQTIRPSGQQHICGFDTAYNLIMKVSEIENSGTCKSQYFHALCVDF